MGLVTVRDKSDHFIYKEPLIETTHILYCAFWVSSPWQPYLWPDGRQAQEVTLYPPGSSPLCYTAHPLHFHSCCILLILPFFLHIIQSEYFISATSPLTYSVHLPTLPFPFLSSPLWHPWLSNMGSWCLQELMPHLVERAYSEMRGFARLSIVPSIHVV